MAHSRSHFQTWLRGMEQKSAEYYFIFSIISADTSKKRIFRIFSGHKCVCNLSETSFRTSFLMSETMSDIFFGTTPPLKKSKMSRALDIGFGHLFEKILKKNISHVCLAGFWAYKKAVL